MFGTNKTFTIASLDFNCAEELTFYSSRIFNAISRSYEIGSTYLFAWVMPIFHFSPSQDVDSPNFIFQTA